MANKKKLKAVQAAQTRKRKRNKRKKRALILGIEIIILLFLLGTAYVMAKYDKFQSVSINSEDLNINKGAKKEGYTTVALFGGDSREGQLEKGTHADTIIVVSIDNKSGEVRMSSIYRDTLLQQMNERYHKANNAYFHGGPEEAIQMLNKNLDLDIEDYVTVDFKAMADVVDLMGGVEINVTEPEANMINEYLGETASVAGKEAKWLSGGGVYNLDGPQAVTYARIRKLEGGDYKRAERQRTVIKALFEKVRKTDLPTLNKIVDKVFPQVSTSFSLKDILGLASGVMKYKLADSQGFPFERDDSIRYKSAGSVVVPVGLAENVQELHAFLYPKEDNSEVSDTVRNISAEITYLTGIERPKEMDQKSLEDGSDASNEPAISEE